MRLIRPALAAASAIFVLAACSNNSSTPPTVSGTAFRFNESVGQFYKDYTGPQRPALNAIGADGRYDSATQSLLLDAKMAGPVFAGGPNYYIWGMDRGGATSAPFADESNVKFNAVIIVTADPANGTTLTSAVNLLNGSAPTPATSAVLIAPDTIEVTVAASQLAPTGGNTSAAQCLWNLWPRAALGGTTAAQIASFIPDNTMANLTPR